METPLQGAGAVPGQPGAAPITVLGSSYETRYLVANPASASDWAFTVAAEGWLELQSVVATLTCSATVANRAPMLVVSDGTEVIASITAAAVITASAVAPLCWMAGDQAYACTGYTQQQTLPLPKFKVQSGYKIYSLTAGLSAGDQWSSITIYATMYRTGPPLPNYSVVTVPVQS